MVALALNLVIYVCCDYLILQSERERHRVERLFAMTRVGVAEIMVPGEVEAGVAIAEA